MVEADRSWSQATADGRVLSCRDVRERLPAFLAGRLGRDDQALVRRHLEACAECRAQSARVEDQLPSASVAREPTDDLWARVDRSMVEARTERRRRRSLLGTWRGPMVAALVVALGLLGALIYFSGARMPVHGLIAPDQATTTLTGQALSPTR